MSLFNDRSISILGVLSLCSLFASQVQSQIETEPSSEQIINFEFTGETDVFEVPANVYEITIETWGAQGQASTNEMFTPTSGGRGGYATGILNVLPGQQLYINVGGSGTSGAGGFNGGGQGGMALLGNEESIAVEWAGSGGGASDVRLDGEDLESRVIVAGGGGGGGRDYVTNFCLPCGSGGNGGDGGGQSGQDGESAQGTFTGDFFLPESGGKGGTQLSGGVGGLGSGGQSGSDTLDGYLNTGGRGQSGVYGVASGGGGGGYFGGGAGGAGVSGSGEAAGGGGGGSSFIGLVLDGATTAGVREGNGLVTLRYTPQPDQRLFVIPLKNGKLVVFEL